MAKLQADGNYRLTLDVDKEVYKAIVVKGIDDNKTEVEVVVDALKFALLKKIVEKAGTPTH